MCILGSSCQSLAEKSEIKALCDINGSVGIYSSRLPVRSIIFLGAPHKGLETTALETLVKSQATEDMIRELKAESPTLTELNDKFRHVAKDIDILTCYELSPTKTAIEVLLDHAKHRLFTNGAQMPDGTWKREGPPIMMVSLDSARQWYPREELVACNADHSQIAKLKRGENSIYPSVRWAIKKALLSAGDLYSEVKGIRHDEPRHLGSVEESSALRRSLLQASHRQVSMPSNESPADPAPISSRSISDDATDHQIKKLRQMKLDQFTRDVYTQSNNNPLNKTVSQWQSGINASNRDGTRSFSSPTDSANLDTTSILFDESGVASMSTNATTSLDAETATPKEPIGVANPELPEIDHKVDGSRALQRKDLDITTDGAKSMIMNEVLASAITEGDEEKTRELFAHSYDVNCKDKDGFTPLLLAARYKKENVLRLLLEKGANPGAKCNKGQTTLHSLALSPELPISETMIDLLLKNRPPFDLPDDEGATPLMTACAAGEHLLATKLINHGANIRAISHSGKSPLHRAAFEGKAHMIPLLIANGAALEAKTLEKDGGFTPLHLAAFNPSDASDTVECLLQAGADKEARASSWKNLVTPSHIAIENNNKACLARLLEYGANTEVSDRYGLTLLLLTAKEGKLEMVKSLLDHGANANAVASDGRTSLH